MQRVIAEAQAWQSATNGRGPWWNSGAAAYERSVSQSFFLAGLLIDSTDYSTYEPPYTEPFVRWCGRRAGVTPPPTQSIGRQSLCDPYTRSKRSRFITLFHAATKSRTNFSFASSCA